MQICRHVIFLRSMLHDITLINRFMISKVLDIRRSWSFFRKSLCNVTSCFPLVPISSSSFSLVLVGSTWFLFLLGFDGSTWFWWFPLVCLRSLWFYLVFVSYTYLVLLVSLWFSLVYPLVLVRSASCNLILICSTSFYLDLLDPWFCLVLLRSFSFSLFLLGSPRFFLVLLGSPWLYLVPLGLVSFFLVC